MRWAADTFTLGGDVVDLNTPFAGRDKVQHLVAGALVQLLLERWAGAGLMTAAGATLCLAVAWEALEAARMAKWEAAGCPQPWPVATDDPSWRDVVATLAGALLAWVLL